jgi:hypothetical protein
MDRGTGDRITGAILILAASVLLAGGVVADSQASNRGALAEVFAAVIGVAGLFVFLNRRMPWPRRKATKETDDQ